MKVIYKIIIILGAIISIFAAISVFYKTRVAMPEKLLENNPHQDYLRKRSLSIIGVDPEQTEWNVDSTCFYQYNALEDAYKRQMLSLKRFYEEKLISKEIYNQQLDTFVLAYCKAFIYQAHCVFKNREWSEQDRLFFKTRVSELNCLFDLDYNKVLYNLDSLDILINGISKSCDDYDLAVGLLENNVFDNIDNVTNRIEKSRFLVRDGRLNLNTELVKELHAYPTILGDSHYEKIESLYNFLKEWELYSLSSTLYRYDLFVKLCDDYESDESLYGKPHPKELSNLRSTALNYKDKACDNKCIIEVNGYTESYYTPSWTPSSGIYSYSVYTDHPKGYNISNIASWFNVSEKYDDSFSIKYGANNTSDKRDTYFTLTSGNKVVKVYVSQEIGEPVIKIKTVEMLHNEYQNGVKGMKIRINISTENFYNKTIYVAAYFYWESGSMLKDFNNQYYTSDGQVATHISYTVDSYTKDDVVLLFMPYDELHMSNGKHDLKFYVSILYNGVMKCQSSYYSFYLTK